MKNFQKFLEEITIKGHPSIPGEEPKKQGDKQWRQEAERRAKTRLGIRPGDEATMTPMGMVPSPKLMRLGREIMELFQRSAQFIDGKEEELAELAEKVIKSTYDEILKRYEIELDIKIIKPRQMRQFMEESEEQDQKTPPEFKEVVEEDIRNEVFKRKIANLIIQGEAKNTKHILHSDEVKEGLEEIYGDNWKEAFDIWDNITKIADQMDWIIPTEARAEIMEQQPEQQAGAVKVDWKPKEKESEEDEEDEEVDSYFGGEDEEEMYEEGEEEPMEKFDETPVIKARGIDFPMLLHEAVKGLFEVLSIGGIPEDKRTAQIAFANTGLSDEPEDWKYGVELAADLRDFINKNENVDKYPNIREEVYKMMMDKQTIPTKDFLELMRGILNGTDKARTAVDRMVNKVIDMIKKEKEAEEEYQREMEEYERKMEEYQKELKEWEEKKSKGQKEVAEEEGEIQKIIRKSAEKEEDYSEMSPSQIQKLIDQALEDGDFDKVRELTKYMKEGKEIYLRELEMILEGKNPHVDFNI